MADIEGDILQRGNSRVNENDGFIDVTAHQYGKSNRSRSDYFNINTFKTELHYNDTVATHSYLVTFAPFRTSSATAGPLDNFLRNYTDTIVMRCDSAIIPALNIMTDGNVRRYGYGPVEHMPHGAIYNDIAMSWIVDAYGLIPTFFHDWLGAIVSTQSYGGADMIGQKTRGNLGFSPYEIGYKDDYANYCMSIFIYDRSLKTVMEYKCYDVFPRSVMDVPLHWGETDQLMRLQVLFSFTDMEPVASSIPTFENLLRSIPTELETLGNSVMRSIL